MAFTEYQQEAYKQNNKEIDFDEWWDTYRPIKTKSGDLYLFETYGKCFERVMKQVKENPRCVWTMMDNGEILSGFHYVNRLNYLLTKVPFGIGERLCIKNREIELLEEKA